MTFGQRLKYIIKYLRLTQKEISFITTISENKISKLVTEAQNPTIEDVKRLSDNLKFTTDQLLGKDLYFDEILKSIYNIATDLNIDIFIFQKLLEVNQIWIKSEKRFFEIINIDVHNKTISYLDTVNCVKVRKTEEEIEKELELLRENFPEGKDYLLEEYKRLPQIKTCKFKELGKKWLI